MDKVGIATVTYINNYGSFLQSYALQETIKTIGYSPEIINIQGVQKSINSRRIKYLLSRLFVISEVKSYAPRILNKCAKVLSKKYKKDLILKNIKFETFYKNFNFSPCFDSWKDICDYAEKNYQAAIVGSDQNWRPANIAGGYYTLEFLPRSINKISYATSFGIPYVVNSQKDKVKSFLNEFSNLSVREKSGQAIIYNLTSKNAELVCDPTLLLARNTWEEMSRNSDIECDQGYILCYFLGNYSKHNTFIKKLKEKYSLKVLVIPYGEKYVKDRFEYADRILYGIGPYDFLKLIKNATLVCTDSFHGCMFSLIFNKEFFSFYKFKTKNLMSTNNRIDNILEKVELNDRIEVDENTMDSIEAIDYNAVNRKLDDFRNYSYKYLIDSINGKRSIE